MGQGLFSHVWMTQNFSRGREGHVAKVAFLLALFCILQTTGLSNSSTPSHQSNRPSSPSYHNNHTTNLHHTPHHPRKEFPSPKEKPISTLNSLLEELPLQDEAVPFSLDNYELDGYDPVEAYHQLRRHYLTSTSRVDRAHYGISSWAGESVHTRHHHTHTSAPHPKEEKEEDLLEGQQQCYVCLPPNKGSREAKDILKMFSKESQRSIPDCADFNHQNKAFYRFNCPPAFGGCILRIHGLNVSRSCSKYRLNDCKKANSVEFCYCTALLCNDVKPAPTYSGEDDEDDEDFKGSGDGKVHPSDAELVHNDIRDNDITTENDSVALSNFSNDVDNEGAVLLNSVGSLSSSFLLFPLFLLSPFLS